MYSALQYVFYQLSVCFKLSCSRNHVLDLDSSTETKFSRHLVFHLPDTVFTNNLHAGRYILSNCTQQLRKHDKLVSVAHNIL